MKKFPLVIFIVVGIVAGVSIPNYLQYKKKAEVEPFRAALAGYLSIWNQNVSAMPAPAEPYLAGKALIVNLDGGEIDQLHYSLPENIKASSPDDLRSVVFVKCWTEKYGLYTGGVTAFSHICEIAAYDTARSQLSFKDRVTRDPPASIEAGSSGIAERPDSEMLKLLTSMPIRS